MQTQRIIETASELIRTNLETPKCSGEDVVVFFFFALPKQDTQYPYKIGQEKTQLNVSEDEPGVLKAGSAAASCEPIELADKN